MLDTVGSLLDQSPMLALFAAIGLGYAIGRLSIAGFSLDIGAVLFAGLALGVGSLMGVVDLLVSTGPVAGTVWVDSMRTASSDGPIAASFDNGCQANDLRSSRQSTGDSGPETHTSPKPR